MKRSSVGKENDSLESVSVAPLLDPIPLQRTHLFDEPIAAVIAVTSVGTPTFVSPSWLAVGQNAPVPLPPGLVISGARCEEGLFAAPCAGGAFILCGPNYGTFYTITLPFVPENIIICTEIQPGGVLMPHLFCSSNDTLLYFSLEHEIPTNIVTQTVEGSLVTSAVKNDNYVDVLFSCGLLMRVQNSTVTKRTVIEKNCTLLLSENIYTIYQTSSFVVVIMKFGQIVNVFPLINICSAVLKSAYSFYLLESVNDAGPMLTQFEHASMTRLGTLFATNLADSRTVEGNEASHANKKFLLYRGGIYYIT